MTRGRATWSHAARLALLELLPRLAEPLRRVVDEAEAAEATYAASPDLPPVPVGLLRQHMLAPLAYRFGYRALKSDYAEAALYAGVRETLLAELGELFDARGLRAARLKGAFAVKRLYPEPGVRPMGDIDLLVPPDEFSRMVTTLCAVGFRRMNRASELSPLHHTVTLWRNGALDVLDVHQNIAQPGRCSIDLGAVWARAIRPADDALWELDATDAALFHFAHSGRHELCVPAMTYVDGAYWLRYLGEERLAVVQERAVRYRLQRSVSAAIEMTQVLTTSPTDLRLGCRPRWWWPTPIELMHGEPAWRPLQVLRKVLLLDGPSQVAGLLAVRAVELVSRAPRTFSLRVPS